MPLLPSSSVTLASHLPSWSLSFLLFFGKWDPYQAPCLLTQVLLTEVLCNFG